MNDKIQENEVQQAILTLIKQQMHKKKGISCTTKKEYHLVAIYVNYMKKSYINESVKYYK